MTVFSCSVSGLAMIRPGRVSHDHSRAQHAATPAAPSPAWLELAAPAAACLPVSAPSVMIQ